MKTLTKFKTLTLASLIAALTACGGDSDSNGNSNNNSAPTHNGDIQVDLQEGDRPVTIDLLAGTIDTDPGDVIRIKNLSTTEEDLSGIRERFFEIDVAPEAYAPSLDSGETKSIVYTFDVSDGVNNTPRTLTINIDGFDVAPEFSNLDVTYSEEAGDVVVDLLEGATDGDGETLTVSNIVADANNLDGAATVSGSQVSVNTSSFADTIRGGDTVTLTFTYNVEDHNHSLERTATININGVSTEPEPPTVYGPQTASFNTSDSNVTLNLVTEPQIIDWNGDAVSADLSSIAPVGDAPAFEFPMSEGNDLIVNPTTFFAHVATDRTFTYSYTVTDATGLTAEATFELTVTRASQANLLTNGSFEDGETAWTSMLTQSDGTGTVTITTDAAGAFEGSNYAAITGGMTLINDLPALEENTWYAFEGRQGGKCYAAGKVEVRGDVDGLPGELITPMDWFNHCGGNHSYVAVFPSSENMSVSYISNGDAVVDDFRVYKIGFENANNIISEDDSTFENGVGNWVLGAGASVSDVNPVSGSMSLNSGTGGDLRHTLNLGVGAIQNGKRYLLTMDVHIDDYDNTAEDGTFGVWITDPNTLDADDNPLTTYGAAWEWSGGFLGIGWTEYSTQVFSVILDIDRESNVTDWATRDVNLMIGTNVWGQSNNHRIDNIRLFEIE